MIYEPYGWYSPSQYKFYIGKLRADVPDVIPLYRSVVVEHIVKYEASVPYPQHPPYFWPYPTNITC